MTDLLCASGKTLSLSHASEDPQDDKRPSSGVSSVVVYVCRFVDLGLLLFLLLPGLELRRPSLSALFSDKGLPPLPRMSSLACSAVSASLGLRAAASQCAKRGAE